MAGDHLERCAAVCDEMVQELEAQRERAKRNPYDRAADRETDFAIRAVKKIAERIRAQKPLDDTQPVPDAAARLQVALSLIQELRPVIAQSRDSAWKVATLLRVDGLLSPEPPGQSDQSR